MRSPGISVIVWSADSKMTLNYPDQLNYITKGINVQQGIVTAVSTPTGGLFGIYILVVVLSLFIWVQRIVEKNEYGKFSAWLIVSMLLMYLTFHQTVNIPYTIYGWEPTVLGLTASDIGVVDSSGTIPSAPAIDSFFSVATDLVTKVTDVMLTGMNVAENKVFVKDASQKATCSSVTDVFRNAFINYTHSNIAIGTTNAPQMLFDLASTGLPKCVGYQTGQAITTSVSAEGQIIQTSSTNQTCEDFWTTYSGIASSCKASGIDPSGTISDSLTQQYSNKGIVAGINKLAAYANAPTLTGNPWDPGEAGSLESSGGSLSIPARVARFWSTIFATVGAQIQPDQRVHIITLMVTQIVAMGFLVAISPLIILYAIIPVHDGMVVNLGFLLKYLLAFACVTAWYPLLMFLKLFFYGNFT